MVPQRPSFLTLPVIATLVVVAIGLAIAGAITVLNHRADAERQIELELSAIVDLKLEQVSSWRKERQ